MFISKTWLLIILGVALAVGVIGVLVGLTLEERAPSGVSSVSVAEPPPTAAVPEMTVPTAPTELPAAEASMPTASRAVDGWIVEGEYAHSIDAAGFKVFWSNDAATLRVGMTSPGTGYLAIGFDPDDRMSGANFIIGYVSGEELAIRDEYGNGTMQHTADTDLGGRDDILAAAGREAGGKTTLEFVIPLDSRDAMDKPLVPGETYTILVAYHDTVDSFIAKHSRRGTGQIRLDG